MSNEIVHIIGDSTKTDYMVLNKGAKNWRIAPWGDPKNSRLVPASTLLETGEERTSEGELLVSAEQSRPLVELLQTMEELVRCVAGGYSNGVFINGSGGIGKTFGVLATLRDYGMEQGKDFHRITGYTTPAGLYMALYENSNKLIVLDDCDSVFKDPAGLNILKSVLDTMPTRVVSWGNVSGQMPSVFQFYGQIIFISNADTEKAQQNPHMQALMTRVLHITVAGTKDEILEFMISRVADIADQESIEQQEEIRQFLMENRDRIRNLSLRWVVNLVSLHRYSPSRWRTLALSVN